MKSAITIFKSILFVVLLCGFMYGCMMSANNSMAATEKQHNCRYAYNDMCYTREQRPWLFEE